MTLGGRRFLLSLAIVAASVCLALGVSMPTLYAYVSRGLIASHPSPAGRRSQFDVEEVERVTDIAGGAFLAGMSDGAEPERAGSLEYFSKFPRRVVSLCRIKADADDTVTMRQRFFERRHRLLRVAVA